MSINNNRIRVLEELIKKYQHSYYEGEAEISDEEFDLLWDELKTKDPENPLLKKVGSTRENDDSAKTARPGNSAGRQSPADETGQKASPPDIDGFTKTRHLIPMGSQDKAANPEEFLAWARKNKMSSYVVQYKLDGASLELQ